MLLQHHARLREAPSRRQHHMFDAAFFGFAFILRREVASICGCFSRCLAEEALVLVEGGQPGIDVGGVALLHVVRAHDAVLHLVDSNEAAELRRLVRLPFADRDSVLLEEAEHFAGNVRVAFENARLGLCDHLLHEGCEMPNGTFSSEDADGAADDRELAALEICGHLLGASNDGAGETDQLP